MRTKLILKFYFLSIVLHYFCSCNGFKNENNSQTKINEIDSALKKKTQIFFTNPNSDTVITGKEGTIFRIKKQSLVFDDGSNITGELTMEVKEFYKLSDILINGLSTTSDQNLLTTNGMVFINFKSASSHKKIVLKNDSFVNINPPVKSNSDFFKLFYGDTLGDNINWKQNNDTSYFEEAIIDKLTDETSYNGFNAKKLGWINFDKLLVLTNKRTTITIPTDGLLAERHYIVLPNYKCIIAGKNSNNFSVNFYFMPVGQKAILISKAIDNGKIFYSIRDILIGSDVGRIEYKKVNAEDFRKNVEDKLDKI